MREPDEPMKCWHVHIQFTDGAEEIASGDPEVVGEVLLVRKVNDQHPHNVMFEAGYARVNPASVSAKSCGSG